MTRPGILFWLIFPSALVSAGILVAMLAYGQWFFAAWAACSVAAAIAALRWAMPKERT